MGDLSGHRNLNTYLKGEIPPDTSERKVTRSKISPYRVFQRPIADHSMLLSARTSIRHAHLPVELLAVTCTKPSIHRYLSNDASRRAPPSTARGHSRGKVNANATSFRRSAKVPLASTVKTTEVATNKPKRLLEPHVLSQRIKALCDELQLDAAVDMLKNAPKDAQSTPVWNTLIWEALKAERWNLAYKLYTEVG